MRSRLEPDISLDWYLTESRGLRGGVVGPARRSAALLLPGSSRPRLSVKLSVSEALPAADLVDELAVIPLGPATSSSAFFDCMHPTATRSEGGG